MGTSAGSPHRHVDRQGGRGGHFCRLAKKSAPGPTFCRARVRPHALALKSRRHAARVRWLVLLHSLWPLSHSLATRARVRAPRSTSARRALTRSNGRQPPGELEWQGEGSEIFARRFLAWPKRSPQRVRDGWRRFSTAHPLCMHNVAWLDSRPAIWPRWGRTALDASRVFFRLRRLQKLRPLLATHSAPSASPKTPLTLSPSPAPPPTSAPSASRATAATRRPPSRPSPRCVRPLCRATHPPSHRHNSSLLYSLPPPTTSRWPTTAPTWRAACATVACARARRVSGAT